MMSVITCAPRVSGMIMCVRCDHMCQAGAQLSPSHRKPFPRPQAPRSGTRVFLAPRGTGVLSQGPRAPLTSLEALCASALSRLRVLPALSPPGSLLCWEPLLGVLNTCSHGGLLETKPRGPGNQGGGASGQVAVRNRGRTVAGSATAGGPGLPWPHTGVLQGRPWLLQGGAAQLGAPAPRSPCDITHVRPVPRKL